MLRTGLIGVLGLVVVVQGEAKPARKDFRVGQIFIVGNTATRQDVILRQLPFHPGQILSVAALATGERNLASLKLFKGKPTITVLDPEGDVVYKDILVTVEETRKSEGFGFDCLCALEGAMDGTSFEGATAWVAENRGRNATLGFVLLTLEESLNAFGPALSFFEWVLEAALGTAPGTNTWAFRSITKSAQCGA